MKRRRSTIKHRLTRTLLLICGVVYLAVGAIPALPVLAAGILPSSELQALDEWPNYVEAYPCQSSSASTVGFNNITGTAKDHETLIWNILKAQGLTDAQTAGILGNIDQESGFDPTIVEGGGHSNDPSGISVGWGLFQWTPGSKALQDQHSLGVGGSIDDIAVQLNVMWLEFQGGGIQGGGNNLLPGFKAINGNDAQAAHDAAAYFGTKFERFGVAGARLQDAVDIFNQFNGTGGGGTPFSTAGAGGNSSACCATNAGTAAAASVNGTFASLTGDDAISGTFILGFDAGTPKATIEGIFKKYKPAGMYVLGTRDAGSPPVSWDSTFYSALTTDAGHPIIASSDEEGWVTRYQYGFNFPNAEQMSTMSTTAVNNLGKQVGQAMAKNGLNVDLAPVLDVGTGAGSDFHQQPGRTFGDTTTSVTNAAGAFAAGLNSAGVKPVYKHFPGLGDSFGNTDSGPVTSPDISILESIDLLPYQTLASQNNGAVMMDNAHVPGLTAGGQVASTSTAAVSLLRNRYHFAGLITTDDLHATGVGQSTPTAVSMALQAGVDAPLFNYSSPAVLDAAIAQSKAAGITDAKTAAARQLLDRFVSSTAANTNATGACCGTPAPATTVGTVTGGSNVLFYDASAADPAKVLPHSDLTHGATYATGSFKTNVTTPIRIAQSATLGTDTAAAANALDIEPQAATPSFVVPWVTDRATKTGGIFILYSDKADWPAVQANAAKLPPALKSRVRYWIADLTGQPQVTPNGAWGTQYAFGANYDSDVTTAAGWAEVQGSPPGGGGSGATAAAGCATPPPSNGCGGGKYGALVSAGASFAGIDQGIDFVPSSGGGFDICAPASGTITLADQTGHHFNRTNGEAEVIERLDAPPNAPDSTASDGKTYIYYAEIITINTQNVQVGHPIAKGAVIGHNAQSPGIEVGWAPGAGSGFKCPIGGATPCGTSFNDWVQKQ